MTTKNNQLNPKFRTIRNSLQQVQEVTHLPRKKYNKKITKMILTVSKLLVLKSQSNLRLKKARRKSHKRVRNLNKKSIKRRNRFEVLHHQVKIVPIRLIKRSEALLVKKVQTSCLKSKGRFSKRNKHPLLKANLFRY